MIREVFPMKKIHVDQSQSTFGDERFWWQVWWQTSVLRSRHHFHFLRHLMRLQIELKICSRCPRILKANIYPIWTSDHYVALSFKSISYCRFDKVKVIPLYRINLANICRTPNCSVRFIQYFFRRIRRKILICHPSYKSKLDQSELI